MKTVPVSSAEPQHEQWPPHLPVGAFRVVLWSARYDQTVNFYRDNIGLPVLETFHNSYGLDGMILGLPGGQVHVEIVRLKDAPQSPPGSPPRASNPLRRSTTGRPTEASRTGTRTGERWCSPPGSITRRDPMHIEAAVIAGTGARE